MKKHYLLLLTFFLLSINLRAQNLYFPTNNSDEWETISTAQLAYCENRIDSLYQLLEENNTKAFILLKDGKIVLEKYFGTHTASSNWYWASAGKSLTAFIVGIAQQEQLLSIQQTSSIYLGPGWTACTLVQEAKITVRNQLSMTTGLDENVANPFCTLDTCLLYKAEAGTRWSYHNAPYTILDEVISSATGRNLNLYTTQKILTPTGMKGLFITQGDNNVFFSTARTMARFGLLVLNKGKWDNTLILNDSTYFNEMTNSSQNINPAYGYLWWLNGKEKYMLPRSQLVFNGPLCPNAPNDMFCALGKNGQFINIAPSQNLVWIRMGESPDGLEVPYLLNDEIWKYINKLNCNPVNTSLNSISETEIELYPNPGTHQIFLKSPVKINTLEIFSTNGQILKSLQLDDNQIYIPTEGFHPGLYLIRLQLSNKQFITKKWMMNGLE